MTDDLTRDWDYDPDDDLIPDPKIKVVNITFGAPNRMNWDVFIEYHLLEDALEEVLVNGIQVVALKFKTFPMAHWLRGQEYSRKEVKQTLRQAVRR